MAIPKITSSEEWHRERDELLTAEKEATRALDALAARRRRLPMVKFSNDYQFDSPTGPKTLADLFDGRDHFTNNIADLDGLAEAGVSWATVSNMPLAQIEAYKERMGWTLPFVSSRGTSFADDCDAGDGFMLTMFLRDGSDIYRTYSTTSVAWTG